MMEKLSAEEFDENYKYVLERFSNAIKNSQRNFEDITLLAATKTVDVDTINYAINKGISYIGENRVQELMLKYNNLLPSHRHFIGHLQTNKVKDIIDKVEMIESVDSLKLATEISKQAGDIQKVQDILIEINIGNEVSKSGIPAEMTEEFINQVSELPNIRINGLMSIPPISETENEKRKYFRKMNKLFIDMRHKKIDNSSMSVLSMGMSGDFDIAIEEGATLVRIGTSLFGKRIYN